MPRPGRRPGHRLGVGLGVSLGVGLSVGLGIGLGVGLGVGRRPGPRPKRPAPPAALELDCTWGLKWCRIDDSRLPLFHFRTGQAQVARMSTASVRIWGSPDPAPVDALDDGPVAPRLEEENDASGDDDGSTPVAHDDGDGSGGGGSTPVVPEIASEEEEDEGLHDLEDDTETMDECSDSWGEGSSHEVVGCEEHDVDPQR